MIWKIIFSRKLLYVRTYGIPYVINVNFLIHQKIGVSERKKINGKNKRP